MCFYVNWNFIMDKDAVYPDMRQYQILVGVKIVTYQTVSENKIYITETRFESY